MPATTLGDNLIPPSLLNAGSIHSQGSNFLQAVQTGVDPRTGQFNLAISVPLGQANNLGGPSWSFTLNYNALNSQLNTGFGFGWALHYTHLSGQQSNRTLILSSGEKFSVNWEESDLEPGGRLVFHDYKLKAMHVSVEDDPIHQGEIAFRITHKSGESEFIRQFEGSGDVYLIHELRSAEGRSLYFDWTSANDVIILRTIRDNQNTLAQYNQTDNTLTLHPHTEHSSTYRFQQSNERLSDLWIPEVQSSFKFIYTTVNVGDQSLLLPSRVNTPLGAMDEIRWSETLGSSHRLPRNAPIAFIPRVVSWIHTAGPNAKPLYRTYEWDQTHNYLGGGSSQEFDWQAGTDSLYLLTESYEYSCTETQSTGNAEVLRALQTLGYRWPSSVNPILTILQAVGAVQQVTTIKRTWDRHHLLIKEVTQTGECQTTVDILYGVDYDKHWSEQIAQCQLPHSIETTYEHLGAGTQYSEKTVHEYDEYGNTLLTRFANQVEEVSTYYPTDGRSPGCPADASGMVRFLETKTVKPAPGKLGNAPILTTRFEYEDLASLIKGDPPHAVVCLEELKDQSTGMILETTEQTYERIDVRHYGRQKQAITALNDKQTTTDFEYEIDEQKSLLWSKTTVQGFEKSEMATSVVKEARSLLTGLTYCEQSAAGMQTAYEYDLLGRIVRTVIAKDTSYQVARTCAYHIDDDFVTAYAPRTNGELAVVVGLEECDATGQRKRTWLDGRGEAVLIQFEDIDNSPGLFFDITETQYDEWGREVERTEQDRHPDGSLLLKRTTTTAYDDWGAAHHQTAPTGVITYTLNDPTLRCTEAWREGPDGSTTSNQVTHFNEAGSPIKTVLQDDQRRVVRTTEFTRDGLDRVIKERVITADCPDVITEFEYDSYSRVAARKQHYEEGGKPYIRTINWSYAGHSDGDHPESVSVVKGKAQVQAQGKGAKGTR